jgi:hypothetical protein
MIVYAVRKNSYAALLWQLSDRRNANFPEEMANTLLACKIDLR